MSYSAGLAQGLSVLITAHRNWLVIAGYRPRTITDRTRVLRTFERTLGGRQLVEATRLDVEAFLARDLKPQSRRAYLSHLRSFWRWALDEQYAREDPTQRVPSVRVPKGSPRPIDADDLRRAVVAADPRMRAWLLLMALAGLRCLEVSGLRPQDLLESPTGTLLFLQEVKGGGTATVPAHPEVLAALADVPIRNGIWWRCDPHSVSSITGRYLKAQGIQASAHQLRHWAGTSWYRASGHDLLTVKRLMRHASVQSTEGYVALDPTRPAAVVDLVPRLLVM